ncbi:hypothetical protein PHYBOEH_003434 [Phytophthora boehmeriae]|uniref:Uncharacterized protein n=1 Tax=Phytophthora boehmeriae TaxID=109152 RepID=A0A8T1WNV4_9STRA|nr:hypothetical protein PHYBOEH_003434 [Phytophthora boehmeriae]
MEAVQVAQAPMDPIEKMALVEPVTKDTQDEHVIEDSGCNNPEVVSGDTSKALEPETILQAPTDESRPVDIAIISAPDTSADGATSIATEDAASLQLSPEAEVVTPAGTIGVAPLAQEDRISKPETPNPAMATTPCTTTLETESKTSTNDQNETTLIAPATAATGEKKHKTEKKQNESFASAETLDEVQKFLTLQIAENRCSSHAKEINEFMEQHLNEKQRKRYVASLVERIAQHFAHEAAAKGEEVSVDVQSNICLIEQMFLTLGRRSPLQDMYTAEEEEMLDLLFHSNSSNDLPINT